MGKKNTLAIADVYAAYVDGVNQRDGETWIGCWDDEAVWQIRDKVLTGTHEIKQTWEAAMAGYAQVHFFSQIGRLDISGAEATARVYTLEFLTTQSGEARTQIGEYTDNLIRKEGRWRFKRRAFHVREVR